MANEALPLRKRRPFKELNAAVVIARANYNTRGMHQQTGAMLVNYILPSMLCRVAG